MSTAFRASTNRLNVLEAHHADRLTEIEGILKKRPGVSCWDTPLALTCETLTHLVLLERWGRGRREAAAPPRFYRSE
jgi:hypothetical protein